MRTVSALDTAGPEELGLSTSRLSRIDDLISRWVAQQKLPEAVTLIARRGKVVHFSAVGPVERDAIFRIASMTKPITSVAALMLFEEGHFLLDDPIAEFLPEFANTRVFSESGITDLERPISIRHVCMHTSGIGYDWSSVPEVARLYREARLSEPDVSMGELSRRLAGIPLNHQPGARWTYGLSHDVLARLVEVISGQPFDAFLRDRIFEPLGMIDTAHFCSARNANRLAVRYAVRQGGGIELATEPDFDYSKPRIHLGGGGGLVSTAADYANFCQMLLNGGHLSGERLLGRKTVELMSTNQTGATSPLPKDWPADWSMLAYGFGLGVRVLIDLARSNAGGSIGEYGWQGSASTYFWIDPVEELFGIFMTQLEGPEFRYGRTVQALAYQALVDQ